VQISVSLALSQTSVYTARPVHGYETSASRGVPVFVSAFAGTPCAYPQKDGQAESIRVSSYMPYGFTSLPGKLKVHIGRLSILVIVTKADENYKKRFDVSAT